MTETERRAGRRETLKSAHTVLRLLPKSLYAVAGLGLVFMSIGARHVTAQVNVLTYHNDNARTGQNLNESLLTPANVNAAAFGKLFSYPVDGSVYAQPLYASNVSIPSLGIRNVVFVVTEHDSVYAFDADDNAAGVVWHTSFIDPEHGVTTVPFEDVNTEVIVPEVGITSTPVIDGDSGTLYVVAKTKELAEEGTTHYVQRLHALDITTGAEMFGGPIVIADTILAADGSFVYVSGPTVAGSGTGTVDGLVSFNALRQLNRPGLLLLNGVIYSAWGSHDDIGPYHGWILGHDAQTLALVAVFNTTPDGDAGAVWMSGGAPAADVNGNIYVVTGNGTFVPTGDGSPAYGDSVLKLRADLSVVDSFTPFEQAELNANDGDFGSGGVLLLPDQGLDPAHLMLAAGKTGAIYLIDRDNLGGYQVCGPTCDNVVQVLPDGTIGGEWGSPAYFNGLVYYNGSSGDVLQALQLSAGQLSPVPISQSATPSWYPGPTPAVSANGSSSGIVWTLQVDGYATGSPAILHAYDAQDLAHELYNSSQMSVDQLDGAVRFTVPTIANGKVYVGTQNSLAVFGAISDGTVFRHTLSSHQVDFCSWCPDSRIRADGGCSADRQPSRGCEPPSSSAR